MPDRRFAYCDSNGHAVFTTTIPGGSEPHAVDGLTPVLLTSDPGSAPSQYHKLAAATGVWTDPRTAQQKTADKWVEIRQRRDAMLRSSDFTQLGDSPKNKQAWATYRQALRDITQQPDPFNVVWPTPPSN